MVIPLTVVAFSPILVLPRIRLHFATRDQISWASDHANAGARRYTKNYRLINMAEEGHAETKKKRYPGVLGTPDKCGHSMSSDCDRHADGTPAEQYDYGERYSHYGKQYFYDDDSTGVIRKR